MPSVRKLAAWTKEALDEPALSPAGAGAAAGADQQPPRPVPERVGEPSLIQHVVYIIKENRTYDQVLGDVESGNGEPAICATLAGG